MKKFLFLLGFGVAGILRAEPPLEPNDFVAICGDSITEQRMYSVFMEDYFLMCRPVPGLRAMQVGWGGEQTSGFLARLGTDLFPFQPTVVTTCYGMNDGLYAPLTPEVADKYRSNQTAIVEALKKNGVRTIVVGSPGCVDTFTFHYMGSNPTTYNQTLSQLAAIAKDVAGKEGVLFADVHGVMNEVMTKSKAALGEKYLLTGGDGIHPTLNGHLAMAYAFLKALGCDGAIGTITVDLATGKAQGTPGQKIVSFNQGVVQVESSRYPFCLTPETSQIAQFFPFNDELNRYLLVVHGLKTTKASVTWGTESREFSAAELERGINLAATFPTNPFSEPFAKLNALVYEQQTREVILVKLFLHAIPDFKGVIPDGTAELDQLAAKGVSDDRTFFQSVTAQVTPVSHTIKIEPVP